MQCNLCKATVAADELPRFRKQGCDIFRCRSCTLLFRGDPPTAGELPAIYGSHYFQNVGRSSADGYADYLRDEAEHRLTARHRVRWLASLGLTGRLLDVGAAAGFFMAEARQAGWSVEGIDVSPEMVHVGREQLQLDVACGLFQDAEYCAASFDVVSMWDYIEHSIDPAADFAKAAAVLRSGGSLVLSTGDAASLVARVSGRRWHLLTPRHHNFFFTSATLARYLNAAGFELLHASHRGAYYSFSYLTYKLRTMVPHSHALRSLGEWVDRHSIGGRTACVNLFDIVTIHARRR